MQPADPASRQRPLRCRAEGSRSWRRGTMPSSSGAERCLLAPRNINDSNGDDELTWRSWGSRKQPSHPPNCFLTG
eukprot:COSAG01_NODE_375_length_17945_cov_175.968284_8_plen_75_part_00